MSRNLEDINKVRVENGLTPLDKLPEDKPAGDDGSGESGEKKKDDPDNLDSVDKKKDPPAQEQDLDDQKLLEILAKKGITVASIEDLKPKEDPDAIKERREAAKLTYGLQNGKFTRKQYDSFITDTANIQDIVYREFYKEAKSEDPDLTDEEINAEFAERYATNADPDSRQFKRGVKEVALLADRLLREKYSAIYAVDSAFDQYESAEIHQKKQAGLILSKAPAYKQDVDTVFTDLAKMKVPVDENEEYEITIPSDIIGEVKNMFLDTGFSASKIAGGWTKENLTDIALATIRHKYFPVLAIEIAKQYALKNQAGSKGIIPKERGERGKSRALTDNQKIVLAEAGIKEEDLPAVN